MNRYTCRIELKLVGPVLTQSSTPGEPGVDAVVARDGGGNGKPILPGTLVSGRLRQAWEELSAATGDARFATDLLGPDRVTGRDVEVSNEPRRARLRFADLTADRTGSSVLRHRVAIDPETGAAEEHMLLALESPFAPGEEVLFSGEARFVARDDPEAREIRQVVELGLRWVSSFGAGRTVGFGRVRAVVVGDLVHVPVLPDLRDATDGEAKCAADHQLLAERPWLDLAIRPLTPFCFAEHRREENLYVSQDAIPGAAVKGCLAAALRLAGELPAKADGHDSALATCFDALVFTFAFPVERGSRRRPIQVPESVIKAGAAWRDLALQKGDGLVDGVAPEFQIDWKDDADVKADFGWTAPAARELRVRTAINREKLRAEDRHLFAQELVVPAKHEWLGRVSLAAVPKEERAVVAAQLQKLLATGLYGLGKTKARAEVDVLRPGPFSDAMVGKPEEGPPWVVVLQTPAVLGWPEDFEMPDPRHGAQYEHVWGSPDFGGVFRLVRHFSRQRLAGGSYLWHRFQSKRPYNPWLLTEAGSVFVLDCDAGRRDEAVGLLQRWQLGGLPLPGWVRQAYDLADDPAKDWQHCPFLRENGYGEIQVNLACHRDLQRRPQGFNPIRR